MGDRWIESHTALRHHPKLRRLAKSLQIAEVHAVGILHALWWYAAEYAPNGDLSGFSDEEIGDICECADGNALRNALRHAGFLDESLRLHDWDDYYGRMMEMQDRRREANRERQRRHRERHSGRVERKTSIAEHVVERNALVTRDVTRDVTPVTLLPNQTQPNQTQPNQTEQDQRQDPPTPQRGESATALVHVGPTSSTRQHRNGKGGDNDRRFEQFWSVYPRRVAKASARKAWDRLAPDDELTDIIVAAIAVAARSPDWRKDDGQFIPHPATWLNGKRWEDERTRPTGTSLAERADEIGRRLARLGYATAEEEGTP